MRSFALDFESRRPDFFDVPEPGAIGTNEVLIRIVEGGICGTDRDLAQFQFGTPPAGESRLVLGHEALGHVVSVGPAVSQVRRGDWVVPMVRRPCLPPCASCLRGRADLCLTGGFTERGIAGAHGFFRELAVEDEAYLRPVPAHLAEVAVLAEPLSVVEKALETALRLHAGEPRRLTVLGAGSIGILTAMAGRERGLEAAVWSLEEVDSPRSQLVRAAGFRYSSGTPLAADIVIEATGSPTAAAAGIAMLGPLGVMIVLGAPHIHGSVPLLNLILGNQIVAGSVNAGPGHWDLAVRDLGAFDRRTVDALLERRRFAALPESLSGLPQAAPKLVHRIA